MDDESAQEDDGETCQAAAPPTPPPTKRARKPKPQRSRVVKPKRRGTYVRKVKPQPQPGDEGELRWNSTDDSLDSSSASSAVESQDESSNIEEDFDYIPSSQEQRELMIVSPVCDNIKSSGNLQRTQAEHESDKRLDPGEGTSQESDCVASSSMHQSHVKEGSSDPAAGKADSGSSAGFQDNVSARGPIDESVRSDHEPYSPPDVELVTRLLGLVNAVLYDGWKAFADNKSIRLVQIAPSHFSAIQREIIVNFDGSCNTMAVHCKEISESIKQQICAGLPEPFMLTEDRLHSFASRCVSLCRNMKQFQTCLGANHLESFSIWSTVDNAYIDSNPYFESEYVMTCRAEKCVRLVPFGKKNIRCEECTKIIKTLRDRVPFAQTEEVSASTPNKRLSLQQALAKLKKQHDEIRRRDKRIAYLEKKVKEAYKNNNVMIEEGVSLDFSEILSGAKLSMVQELFLRQQLEYISKNDPRGHRWHPAMIRFALHIKSISSAAYEAMRDSGFINLPSSRTLFNYSHYITPTENIKSELIQLVKNQVKKSDGACSDYFALLVDEMYVSKNLVYRKVDGKLIGYTHLDEVDKEMEELENRLNSAATSAAYLGEDETPSVSKPHQPVLASKMLAFMIKGLCTSIKCVVASYPVTDMNKDMLYTRSWDLISRLESAGLKILCYVCDGNASNRGFFNMHTPITKGVDVVFDTVNFCSPERRPLYFISDVSHLIKTVRNCFHNSGTEEKKTRCMTLNGEKIQWRTIVRLYLHYKNRTFRKSYKLNPQNVFINSFSVMKVKFAAQVLSKTVATDIAKQKWSGTNETVKFILMFNKFFDILNGAHSSQWLKTRNEDLRPYETEDDKRFTWLLEDLLEKYLNDWKKKSASLGLPPKEREKTMLASQTLEGIEVTIRSIIASIKFLLKSGAKFVMARAFSQDPLEQHFSKQRAGGGGSTNPNPSRFDAKVVSVAVTDNLGMKRRGANVEDEEVRMENLSEPLPKRPKTKKPSFV